MPLHDVVIPNLEAVLVEAVNAGRFTVSVGGTTFAIGAIREGEQDQVAQPPEIWILNANATFPEKQGSELEQSDWYVTLRMLYPFQNDGATAEKVLGALIEPVRQVFRLHLHLLDATKIARARVLNAQWSWTVINEIIYRVCELRVGIKEKVPVQWNP